MSQYFGAHTLQGEWHSLLPRYVALGDRIQNNQVLDIGCGTGIGSSLLLEMGAQEVNGIDHRPEVLELARIKHAKQGLNFRVMFWEELEFPDNTFDTVLCLDPTSPVTDRNLLLEIQRVLRPGGEYICAIERKPVDGFESLLPRYGYDTAGQKVELAGTDQRVPQLGELEELFGSIESVLQRPQFSFRFEPDGESDDQTDGDGTTDTRLADQNGEPAAVELLFCGDEQMPPPSLREVEMPYRQLVDRLQQLFGDLQLHRHPDEETTDVRSDESAKDFQNRQQTSEFQPVPAPDDDQPQTRPVETSPRNSETTDEFPRSQDDPAVPPSDRWQQVNQQLDRMTRMYQRMRDEMESLFMRTRRELAERDRYIEQLVDTVHRHKHDNHGDDQKERLGEPVSDTPASGVADDPTGLQESSSTSEPTDLADDSDDESRQFERRTTNIFDRPSDIETEDGESASLGGETTDPEETEQQTDDDHDDEDDAPEPSTGDTDSDLPNTEESDDDRDEADKADDSDDEGEQAPPKETEQQPARTD